jgi:Glyoxalase/Bleomycin resistance protein/Dioxygenase superfamily
MDEPGVKPVPEQVTHRVKGGTMSAVPTNALGAAITSGVQLAYITNDMDEAIGVFEDRMGIGPWVIRQAALTCDEGESETPQNIELKAAFAYMRGRMFEIIQPVTEAPPVFTTPNSSGCVIAPHHVGAYVPDGGPEIIDAAQSSGLKTIRFRGAVGEIIFVDTRSMVGHWLEALCFPNVHPL